MRLRRFLFLFLFFGQVHPPSCGSFLIFFSCISVDIVRRSIGDGRGCFLDSLRWWVVTPSRDHYPLDCPLQRLRVKNKTSLEIVFIDGRVTFHWGHDPPVREPRSLAKLRRSAESKFFLWLGRGRGSRPTGSIERRSLSVVDSSFLRENTSQNKQTNKTHTFLASDCVSATSPSLPR